jgi:hypothetical protein
MSKGGLSPRVVRIQASWQPGLVERRISEVFRGAAGLDILEAALAAFAPAVFDFAIVNFHCRRI